MSHWINCNLSLACDSFKSDEEYVDYTYSISFQKLCSKQKIYQEFVRFFKRKDNVNK